jgi:hypothetical protein
VSIGGNRVLGVSRIVEIGLPSVVAVPMRVATCEP